MRRLAAAGAGVPGPDPNSAWFEGQAGRFLRFSAFSYLAGFLGFFTDMGFAAPALALTLSPDQVALFATGFKLTFMTVVLVVSGFRGVYQPVFARLRIRNDPGQLERLLDGIILFDNEIMVQTDQSSAIKACKKGKGTR